MKPDEVINQLIRQRIQELAQRMALVVYEPLDEEWENLIKGEG